MIMKAGAFSIPPTFSPLTGRNSPLKSRNVSLIHSLFAGLG